MEQKIWRECQRILSAGESPPLRSLSAVRSLISNPSTSDATVSSILQTLTTSLCLPHHRHHHHILSLLSAVFLSRTHLSHLIFGSVSSFFSSYSATDTSSFSRLAVAVLSLLLSMADCDSTLRSSMDSIDDGVLVALSFRPCVQVRMWILNNATRLRIEPNLLVTVFLGFTKDPYPEVRRAALDGLSKVSKNGVAFADCGVVEGCFLRAVELLGDAEDYVRAAAIRVVSRWGGILLATKNESVYNDCSDFLFIQVCSMVRDMSVAVRLEAFYAIGNIRVVSDNVLMLTHSKKVQGTTDEKKTLGLSSGKRYEVPITAVAGAFLHGIEDEFSEVRGASCKSLKEVSAVSLRFASEAATLLMYVMNDESVMVRLQAVETIYHMVSCNHLKLQHEHIHVLVATISDKSHEIRIRAMEVLGLDKLPNAELFKLYVERLLGNLGLHPQDEANTLCALFKSGQVQSKFAFRVIENVYDEMTDAGGKLAFDKPEMIGLVVLAISVSFSVEAPLHHILQRIISAAAVFLGRISYALKEVMNQKTLLAHLSQSDSSQMETNDWLSETLSNLREGTLLSTRSQKQMCVEVGESVKLILATAMSSWQLAKSGCTSEAIKVLRCCQEEMDSIGAGAVQVFSILDFGMQYVRVLELLTKMWGHVMFPRKHFSGMGCLDLLLNKLEKHITHLRHRFTGFSKEDELHILEFVLLGYVLRLYRVQTCCKTSKKLSTTVSHVVHLCQRISVLPSEFVSELSSENCAASSELTQEPLLLKSVINLFDVKDIPIYAGIKHIKADLEFPGFDSESPFGFISGLPVGISCEITLYNVSSETRLWLDMKVDGGLSQFIFLDLDQSEGYKEVMKFVYNAPLFRTPDVAAFALTTCIGMECFSEDLPLPNSHLGPRNPLVYLCEEKEIELFRVDRI